MSYIRPLSNPEALYVIGTLDGQVEFVGSSLKIPRHVFHQVAKLWSERQDRVSRRGLTIEEITDPGPDQYKWKLTYKRFPPVVMWQVTWFYIVQGILERR